MSTTYNISRAYTYPRNKRATKAVRILKKKMEKNEEDFEISNELNNHIWKRGAQKPPKKVTVDLKDVDGKRVAVPADTDTVSKPAQETKKEETSAEESVEASVLDGTVSEAKDGISNAENPDYERLLELEKDGKNRKTLVEWLEGKV